MIPDETQQFSKSLPQDKVGQVSIRAWIALIFVFSVCFMAIFGKQVEEPLYSLSVMAVGFYFGQQKNTPPKI